MAKDVPQVLRDTFELRARKLSRKYHLDLFAKEYDFGLSTGLTKPARENPRWLSVGGILQFTFVPKRGGGDAPLNAIADGIVRDLSRQMWKAGEAVVRLGRLERQWITTRQGRFLIVDADFDFSYRE